jgi:hypothetical protein
MVVWAKVATCRYLRSVIFWGFGLLAKVAFEIKTSRFFG